MGTPIWGPQLGGVGKGRYPWGGGGGEGGGMSQIGENQFTVGHDIQANILIYKIVGFHSAQLLYCMMCIPDIVGGGTKQ